MMLILEKSDLIHPDRSICISNFKAVRLELVHEAAFVCYIDGDYHQVLKDRYQGIGRDSTQMELFKKAIYNPIKFEVLKDRNEYK